MRLFGVDITVDFRGPAFARGEEVTRADGVTGHVTHFDGDQGYNNCDDEDVFVEWEDGLKCWEYPDQMKRKGKR